MASVSRSFWISIFCWPRTLSSHLFCLLSVCLSVFSVLFYILSFVFLSFADQGGCCPTLHLSPGARGVSVPCLFLSPPYHLQDQCSSHYLIISRSPRQTTAFWKTKGMVSVLDIHIQGNLGHNHSIELRDKIVRRAKWQIIMVLSVAPAKWNIKLQLPSS